MDDDFSAPAGVPREDLERAFDFNLDRADSEGDGLTLSGYASVFNSPTRISSWEGNFDEVVLPGAFKKSIRERPPVLMFNHGKHPMIADLPLGRFTTIKEDARGLFVEARLSDNWLVQPVRDAIAEGSITGMSFRFSVVKDAWTQPTRKGDVPLRSLQEVRCAECGPVVFPAYLDTTVGVRAAELAAALLDPEIRVEVARALLLGTPEGAGLRATSQGAASQDQEPAQTTPDIPLSDRLKRANDLRGIA